MTTLGDFGVDVPEGESEPEPEPEETAGTTTQRYPNGRCPAIASGHRGRCKAPVSRMKKANGFCATHGRERHPWTIDGDPEELIMVTGEIGGVATLRALDQEDVDFDVEAITEAVDAVKREWCR